MNHTTSEWGAAGWLLEIKRDLPGYFTAGWAFVPSRGSFYARHQSNNSVVYVNDISGEEIRRETLRLPTLAGPYYHYEREGCGSVMWEVEAVVAEFYAEWSSDRPTQLFGHRAPLTELIYLEEDSIDWSWWMDIAGSKIISGSHDGSCRMWSTAFSQDEWVGTVFRTGTLGIDIDSYGETSLMIVGGARPSRALLVTGKGVIQFVDPQTCEHLGVLLRESGAPVYKYVSGSFLLGSHVCALLSVDGVVTFIDAVKGSVAGACQLSGFSDVGLTSWSRDVESDSDMIWSDSGLCWVLDRESVAAILDGEERDIPGVPGLGLPSPDGTWKLSVNREGRVPGRLSRSVLLEGLGGVCRVLEHPRQLFGLHWTRDSSRIMTTDSTGTFRVWDPKSGQVVLALRDSSWAAGGGVYNFDAESAIVYIQNCPHGPRGFSTAPVADRVRDIHTGNQLREWAETWIDQALSSGIDLRGIAEVRIPEQVMNEDERRALYAEITRRGCAAQNAAAGTEDGK